MRTVYRILAYAIAAEVLVQAAAVAYAIAGLGHWVQGGGVLDSATMESEEITFPEVVGFIVHGINGSIVVPLLAVLLVVFAFFAKVKGGVKWAFVVFVLVGVQAQLGFMAGDLPALGALHGLNALLLFAAALHVALRSRTGRPAVAETGSKTGTGPETGAEPARATA
jgi:heme A synthase